MGKWIILLITLCLFTGLLLSNSYMQIPWISIVASLALFLESISLAGLLWKQKKREEQLCRQIEKEKEEGEQKVKECRRQSVEEQTQFYSVFSHSIRMPLSIIKGYAELLESGAIDREDQNQYLEKIIQKSQSIVDFFPKIQNI